jgi:hypothetical protein
MKDKIIRIKKINYFWPNSHMYFSLSMIRIGTFLFIFFFLCAHQIFAQFLIPGEGIMDVKLGADMDEVEWELGFRGEKIEFDKADEKVKLIAENAGIEFDFLIKYKHIMWLPVSDVLLKDNKVCMIQLSSYPEYNQMISADIGTIEGLNFWDGVDQVKQLYGNYITFDDGDKTIVIMNQKGLGVELSENEVRTMFIFEPK